MNDLYLYRELEGFEIGIAAHYLLKRKECLSVICLTFFSILCQKVFLEYVLHYLNCLTAV